MFFEVLGAISALVGLSELTYRGIKHLYNNSSANKNSNKASDLEEALFENNPENKTFSDNLNNNYSENNSFDSLHEKDDSKNNYSEKEIKDLKNYYKKDNTLNNSIKNPLFYDLRPLLIQFPDYAVIIN